MSNPFCGIVMPISPMGDCSAQHWSDVRTILEEAIVDAAYTPRLVSLGDEVSIIHERIVKNLYQDEIVVCDVSHKNANVMFELGLRLAFDKPVIIIKDSDTDYIFDTGPVEHLSYPRSLRFGQVKDFKSELTKKILATVKAKKDDPDFSPFLRTFGPLKAVKFDTKEISSQEAVLDYLSKISARMERLELKISVPSGFTSQKKASQAPTKIYEGPLLSPLQMNTMTNMLMGYKGVQGVFFKDAESGTDVFVTYDDNASEFHSSLNKALESSVEGFLKAQRIGPFGKATP